MKLSPMRGAFFVIVHIRSIYVYCMELSIRFVDTLVWDRSQELLGLGEEIAALLLKILYLCIKNVVFVVSAVKHVTHESHFFLSFKQVTFSPNHP